MSLDVNNIEVDSFETGDSMLIIGTEKCTGCPSGCGIDIDNP